MTTENNTSRLPAGSTLQVADGLNVPHPHAEVNLPGKPDGRIVGGDAVTETLLKPVEVDKSEVGPLGEQVPLVAEVIPGTLVTLGDNTVVHTKVAGHDAVDLLADVAAAQGTEGAIVGNGFVPAAEKAE